MKREKIVCECRRVTAGAIFDALDKGAKSFEELKEMTGCGKGCKQCREYIEIIAKDYLKETGKKNEIESERIRLVPLCREHLEDLWEYAGNPDTAKMMVFLPFDSKEQAKKFLTCCEQEWYKDVQRAYEYGIMLGNKNIGEISVYREGDKAELGWILNKAYTGHGYAYEAAQALIKYAGEHMEMKDFIAHCDTENIASYKLMEKLGMTRVSECGGRRNKLSDKESREYLYEIVYS